jgi:hypothetical protein
MVREKKGTRKRTSLNNPLIWRALVSEITRKVVGWRVGNGGREGYVAI